MNVEKMKALKEKIESDADELIAKQEQEDQTSTPCADAPEDAPTDAELQTMIKNYNALTNILDFWHEINESDKYYPIPTGYNTLDNAINGGLHPEELIFIGALSSLGKTTFMLQMADNIAASGRPVLFFSLEMSRNEIMAKSISRNTFEISVASDIPSRNAKGTQGILQYSRKKAEYSEAEKDLIMSASKRYETEIAKNVYIIEGTGRTGVDKIREVTEQFIRLFGQHPVLFIDYLQILAPSNSRGTDKQNTDMNVSDLKRIARDCSVPVVVISSLNRMNYDEPITMQAFKESGSIEYSSDVLIGLQFKGVETVTDKGKRKRNADFNADEAKAENPRKIELKLLKNRNGAMLKEPIQYDFYPVFNYYHEHT